MLWNISRAINKANAGGELERAERKDSDEGRIVCRVFAGRCYALLKPAKKAKWVGIRTGDAFRLVVALLFMALAFGSYTAGRLPGQTDALNSGTTTRLEVLATGFAIPTVIAFEAARQPYAVLPAGTLAFMDADFIETRTSHEGSRQVLAGFGVIRVSETVLGAGEYPPVPRL